MDMFNSNIDVCVYTYEYMYTYMYTCMHNAHHNYAFSRDHCDAKFYTKINIVTSIYNFTFKITHCKHRLMDIHSGTCPKAYTLSCIQRYMY